MAGTAGISKQLDEILTEFTEEEDRILEVSLSTAAKSAVKELKRTSPKASRGKNKGRYARGWAVKQEKKGLIYSFVVHNRTDYQLTHLLEKSHVIKNQYGTYGRSTPEPHIEPAEENAERLLLETLEREL